MNEMILAIPGWLLPSLLFVLSIVTLALIIEKGYLLYVRLARDPFADLLGEARNASPEQRERARRTFASGLKRRLPALGTISTVAPLVGLLGTVTGMIKSFYAFEAQDAARPMLLGGIDEALITTCFGLIIAIPALIAYNTFAARVNALLDELDFEITHLDAGGGDS